MLIYNYMITLLKLKANENCLNCAKMLAIFTKSQGFLAQKHKLEIELRSI